MSSNLGQIGAYNRLEVSNGRDERPRRTARPDLPYSKDDGSALAVTASAPRRVCQPSASPLRCGARVAERPRAAAGNRRSVFAWSKNLNTTCCIIPGMARKRRLAMHREMMHANIHIGEFRTSISLDPVVWVGGLRHRRASRQDGNLAHCRDQ